MKEFLLFYAPPLTVLASILLAFLWGGKADFLRREK
ncbi:cytochrome bd oxidase small subunit CydS [Thermicanus aegyptius]